MNFDLENISEEGDCPDPLFDSIMNAMSSMKEATADKIYQKIQREGETNYSKPQVDRALANALKYGIFEVKNNRYRMRDDILDDEDTVYWKLQRNREQTPFRIQDDINERQFGPKLDPEKDNQRFRKIPDAEEAECPQCGRTKKRSEEGRKTRGRGRMENAKSSKRRKAGKRVVQRGNPNDGCEENLKKAVKKRKTRSTSVSQERQVKVRRKVPKTCQASSNDDQIFLREDACKKAEEKKVQGSWVDVKSDLTDSELDSASSFSEEENSMSSRDDRDAMKFRRYKKPCLFSPECDDADLPGLGTEGKKSNESLRSESESEESSESGGGSAGRLGKGFQDLPCSSRSGVSKEPAPRSQQQLGADEPREKDCERSAGEGCEGKSEWLGCSEEGQGAVIQSNNVLTIEPMDSLAFTNPGQASYIS